MKTSTSTKTAIVVSLSFLFGAIGFQCSYNREADITPPDARMGWIAPNDAEVAWGDAQPGFEITDPDTGLPLPQANETADVRLYHAVAQANGGEYPDEFPQQIGDCTSFSAAHAIQTTEAAAIAAGRDGEFHRAFQPYLYGVGRVLVARGRFRGGDGCSNAAVAQGATEYGVMRADADRAPKYTGALARNWGNSGPPKEWIDEAKGFKVQRVAKLRASGDARDALVNGYGCGIASMILPDSYHEKDGRIVATMRDTSHDPRPSGHAMALDSYDGSHQSGRKYFRVVNSWGKTAQPKPVDGSPPNGFWITEQDCDRVVRQGDSWAYSGFDGWPSQEPDLRIFGAKK